MKRLAIFAVALVAVLSFMPSASATISRVETCKTYHSFNGAAKVKICVSANVDNAANRTYVSFIATHVVGFQNPDIVNATLRSWSTRSLNPPVNWCNGRAPGCGGGGNTSAAGGVPLSFSSDFLYANEHYCEMHGEALPFIRWPGGGTTDGVVLNSPDTDTIGAGCLF
jgi:hypothetical protein